MNTAYVVRTLPVRDAHGTVLGWVRVDLMADGSKPTDTVYLRDGMACGQAEAMRRITRDTGLLYATEAEAVREGIARLREADSSGSLRRVI